MIRINDKLSIGGKEIRFTFTRSQGPGGQRVNKVATKATLHFDLADSQSLSEPQKDRLRAAMPGRINSNGILRVVRSRYRTRTANRQETVEAFASLLAQALTLRKPRKKTKPTRASRERRLTAKAHRSSLKQQRRRRHTRCEGD